MADTSVQRGMVKANEILMRLDLTTVERLHAVRLLDKLNDALKAEIAAWPVTGERRLDIIPAAIAMLLALHDEMISSIREPQSV